MRAAMILPLSSSRVFSSFALLFYFLRHAGLRAALRMLIFLRFLSFHSLLRYYFISSPAPHLIWLILLFYYA